MYQTKDSNLLVTACPLVILAALHVPTLVQTQHPYRLVSATVDNTNPRHGSDVFTLDAYRMIEFAYVDDGISQVQAIRRDGVEKIARFRGHDYHTMIFDTVIFDTGNPNQMVKCQFKDKNDIQEFYGCIKPEGRRFTMMTYGVISVFQYDCIRVECENGTCDDPSCDGNYHDVSGRGQIHTETIIRANNNRPSKRRFVIRDEDDTINMVFTSRTFNMTPVGNNARVMMGIRIKHLLFKILIEFEDVSTGQAFYDFVDTNHGLDRDIPLNIPHLWQNFFEFPASD